MEPGTWECNWATLSLGTEVQGPVPSGWLLDARLTTLLCTKIVTKSEEVKTGFNLVEFL
jgi:hypothetical protein